MIDLHLHTIASDGLHTPAQLVALVQAAGITVMAVADHDTLASVPELEKLTREAEIGFLPGIEITAVWLDHDVHLLGYFVDSRSTRLSAFLRDQRADRERRGRLMGQKLAALGMPIDIEPLVADAKGKALARPALARVLVEAGYVTSVQDAFDRFLGDDKPAWVKRSGATPAEVVALVNAEGGVVSMAHPGVTRRDELIPDLARSGLAALEIAHTDHTADDVARYRSTIREHGLGATGGSDFHGVGTHHPDLGRVTLSADDFADFCRRAGRPVPGQACR
jgi:predicted metal-dependent phosphoesterase TrpH